MISATYKTKQTFINPLLLIHKAKFYNILSFPFYLLVYFSTICLPSHASVCFSSITLSGPTLCDPVDCSTPGFPILHHLLSLLKLMSIESVMPSNYLVLCCPLLPCLQSFLALGSFPTSQFFASGSQSVGVSASASILPKNIQD